MKKTIATLILACSMLVGFSQTFNTDVIAQSTVASIYRQVECNADSCSIGLVAFGSNAGVGTLYDSKTGFLAGAANRMGIINEQSTGNVVIATGGYGLPNQIINFTTKGVMLEANSPTHGSAPSAYLHLGRGTSVAGHAPIKFTLPSSAILTTPEPGAFETDGTDLYFTNSAGVRKKITIQ